MLRGICGDRPEDLSYIASMADATLNMESMNGATQGEVTRILGRWREGERAALDDIVEITYPRLRHVALSFLRRESLNNTIQATGLVHELYLVLLQQRKVEVTDRNHFYSLAASLMRKILCDRARKRGAEKRGGEARRIPMGEDLGWVDADSAEVLDLDSAIDELERLDARKAHLIELKTYLGCSTEEAAEQLSISKATADRELRMARAWLFQRLRGAAGAPAS